MDLHAKILILFWAVLVSACASAPVRQAPWIVVNSPRFEILSSMPGDETIALAKELERFHALIYAVTGVPPTESPVPTRIHVFGRKLHYKRYARKDTAGVFYEGVRANNIVLADYSSRLGASEIILHEYTHFVLNNGSTHEYPIWYNEGFAEFLSTARTYGDMVAVGAIPKARIPSFEYGVWLPMDEVVSATSYSSVEEDEVHMLYAESWALVHYLTLDRPESGSVKADLSRYMGLTERGVAAAVAFEDAFGVSTDEMNGRLKRLLGKRGEYRVIGIPIKNLEYDRSEPTLRVPTESEVAIRLGQLQLARGFGAEAEAEFAAAVAIDPNASRAVAGLGDALKFQEKWEAAEPHFYRAVEIDPDDAMNQLDLAEFVHDQALNATHAEDRKNLLAKARRIYARCREIDESLPEVWLMEGRTYLAPGENPRHGLALLDRAIELLPSSETILLALAEARIALDQDRVAAKLIARAYANRLEGQLQESTLEMIERIRKKRAAEAAKTEGGAEGEDVEGSSNR